MAQEKNIEKFFREIAENYVEKKLAPNPRVSGFYRNGEDFLKRYLPEEQRKTSSFTPELLSAFLSTVIEVAEEQQTSLSLNLLLKDGGLEPDEIERIVKAASVKTISPEEEKKRTKLSTTLSTLISEAQTELLTLSQHPQEQHKESGTPALSVSSASTSEANNAHEETKKTLRHRRTHSGVQELPEDIRRKAQTAAKWEGIGGSRSSQTFSPSPSLYSALPKEEPIKR